MAMFSLTLGRRAGRVILYLIAAYFFLFAPRARRASMAYLRRVLGRPPTMRDRFRQVMAFATTIHDRVYLLNDRFELFDIEVAGEELMQERVRAGRGAFLVGAHLGSFEVTRAMGRRHPGLRVAMVAYEDNARKINAMMAVVNPSLADGTVALGTPEAMLRVRGLLDEGAFVGMLGDRTPGGGAYAGGGNSGRGGEVSVGAHEAGGAVAAAGDFDAGDLLRRESVSGGVSSRLRTSRGWRGGTGRRPFGGLWWGMRGGWRVIVGSILITGSTSLTFGRSEGGRMFGSYIRGARRLARKGAWRAGGMVALVLLMPAG